MSLWDVGAFFAADSSPKSPVLEYTCLNLRLNGSVTGVKGSEKTLSRIAYTKQSVFGSRNPPCQWKGQPNYWAAIMARVGDHNFGGHLLWNENMYLSLAAVNYIDVLKNCICNVVLQLRRISKIKCNTTLREDIKKKRDLSIIVEHEYNNLMNKDRSRKHLNLGQTSKWTQVPNTSILV